MNLNIDSGIKTFTINGEVEVSFNPADTGFLTQLREALKSLDALSEEYRKKVHDLPDDDIEQAFDLACERDEKQRAVINGIFEKDVCGPVFKRMHIDSPSADGLPLWAEFILAIMDECGSVNVAALSKKGSAKLNKYIKKYAGRRK